MNRHCVSNEYNMSERVYIYQRETSSVDRRWQVMRGLSKGDLQMAHVGDDDLDNNSHHRTHPKAIVLILYNLPFQESPPWTHLERLYSLG